MGMAVHPDLRKDAFKLLLAGGKVTTEEAFFRSAATFRPATLKEHLQFWEQEILKDHPNKVNILKWLAGVKIEDFYNPSLRECIPMHSYYPQPQQLDNFVPPEIEEFIDTTVKEWERLGMLKRWDQVKKPGDPFIPAVVSPLGVESSKPRALWDGRYVNEFCRDLPFTMDNAVKVAEVAWRDIYFF